MPIRPLLVTLPPTHWRRTLSALLLSTGCALAAADGGNADAVQRYVAKRTLFEASMKQLNEAFFSWDTEASQHPEQQHAVVAYALQFSEIHKVMDLAYLAELQRDLVTLLGVQAPEGLTNDPQINLHTLAVHMGHRQINGLRYGVEAGDAEVVVSNVALLQDWIASDALLKRALFAAFDQPLASGDLYNAALTDYLAFTIGARLPVTSATAGDRVGAVVFAWPGEHGAAPWPTDVAVASLSGHRLIVGRKRLQVALPEFPARLPRYRQLGAQRKHDAAADAFQACYAKALARHPAIQQATKEAQAFLDSATRSAPAP